MGKGARATQGLFAEAMNAAQTRAGLRARAERVKSSADSIAAGEGVELNSRIEDGVRPKGRPYSRVSSPNVSQEFGDSNYERRRILGRAAEANK